MNIFLPSRSKSQIYHQVGIVTFLYFSLPLLA